MVTAYLLRGGAYDASLSTPALPACAFAPDAVGRLEPMSAVDAGICLPASTTSLGTAPMARLYLSGMTAPQPPARATVCSGPSVLASSANPRPRWPIQPAPSVALLACLALMSGVFRTTKRASVGFRARFSHDMPQTLAYQGLPSQTIFEGVSICAGCGFSVPLIGA